MPDWASIVREHGLMAFQTAWRILGHVQDTEDAVQDALLEAVRIYHEQRVANWGGLIRHFATRRALDRLRRRRRTMTLVYETPAPAAGQPENVAIERELAERLRRALAELPDRQATVFSLRCFGEMSNAEIAVSLGLSIDAVAVALHKARRQLQRLLDVEESYRRSENP